METMTKRECIRNVLGGEPVDRAPVGFWLHFPEEMHHGEKVIEAHLDFMEATDTGILKIVDENILYNGNTKIEWLGDASKFRGSSRKDAIFQGQMEITRRIADKAKGEYPVMFTIHGLIASAFRETGFVGNYTNMGYQFTLFYREHPAEMKKVFRIVAKTFMELSDCSLEADVGDIFYAALGGERNFFTGEGFEEFIAPYEKMAYGHIKKTTDFNVLHICKSNINLNRYKDLHPAIVNWGIYGNGFSLTRGARLLNDSIILGGFPDRHGALVTGTEEEIFKHTSEVLEEMKGRPFIVGSDYTLPTEIAYDRIRCVVDSVEKLE